MSKRKDVTYAQAHNAAVSQLQKLAQSERPSALYGVKLFRQNKAEWLATPGKGASELIGRGHTPLAAVKSLDVLWFTGPKSDYEREE